MKKITTILCLLCSLVLAFGLTACGGGGSTEPEANAYVSLDINPEIELTLDTDNKVMSVYAANEDAQVLLYGEDGVIGLDVETAVEKITALAIELGYLGNGNIVVETSVTTVNDEGEELTEKVNAKVEATAEKLGLTVSANTEMAFSLLRKFEAFKAQNPNNPAIKGLSEGMFKLALSASETGEVTLEAAVEMDEAELIAIISEAHDKVETFATTAYNKAKAEAFKVFDLATGMALDGVYNAFYIKNAMSHFDTVYYGALYQAYKLTARTFNSVADVIHFVENLSGYTLDEEVVEQVAGIFGLTDTTVLQNGNGEITVGSIEAYADKVFKNTEASAQLEELKAEFTTAITQAESAVVAKAEELIETYQPQITSVINTVSATINTVKTTISALPVVDTVLAQFNECATTFNTIVDELEAVLADGVISSAELRKWARDMEGKATEMLAKINEDLTEDEKAEVEQMKTDVEDAITSAKAVFEKALSDAETEAKNHLASLKARRQNA